MASFQCDSLYLASIGSILDPDLSHYSENMTGRTQNYHIDMTRKVSRKDLSIIKLKKMPGFNLKWKFDKQLEPWPKYVNDTKTKLFIRFVDDFQNILI